MQFIDLKTQQCLDKPDIPAGIETVVALGSFDGVHAGHRAILQQAVARANIAPGLFPAVCSFLTHPNEGEAPFRWILNQEERLAQFRACGIRYVFLYSFEEMEHLTPQLFVNRVLRKQCRAHTAVCGSNYRYGYQAAGDAALLEKQMVKSGGKAIIAQNVVDRDGLISSTRIRDLLQNGEMNTANRLLMRTFSITANIIRGNRIGHELKQPTINLDYPSDKLIPRYGVYVSEVRLNGRCYPGISNIGIRPSIDDGNQMTAETHILRYASEADIYGCEATVAFLHYLRPEKTFDKLSALQRQIRLDIRKATQYRRELLK